jgi:hypothetical protein
MAISTLDQVMAGSQPPVFIDKALAQAARFSSTWGAAGIPGPGTFNTTLNGGTYTGTPTVQVVGQIPHFNPSSGLYSYLSRFSFQGTVPTTAVKTALFVMIADRLWDNGGINITSNTAQAIVSPTWPARDVDAATAGRGVLIGLEVSAQGGGGTPICTVG